MSQSQRKEYGLKTNQFHISRCNITSASFDAISCMLSFHLGDRPERANRSWGRRLCSHSNFSPTLFSTYAIFHYKHSVNFFNFLTTQCRRARLMVLLRFIYFYFILFYFIYRAAVGLAVLARPLVYYFFF